METSNTLFPPPVRALQTKKGHTLDKQLIYFDNTDNTWQYDRDLKKVADYEFHQPQYPGRPPNEAVSYEGNFYFYSQDCLYSANRKQWFLVSEYTQQGDEFSNPVHNEYFVNPYQPGDDLQIHLPARLLQSNNPEPTPPPKPPTPVIRPKYKSITPAPNPSQLSPNPSNNPIPAIPRSSPTPSSLSLPPPPTPLRETSSIAEGKKRQLDHPTRSDSPRNPQSTHMATISTTTIGASTT